MTVTTSAGSLVAQAGQGFSVSSLFSLAGPPFDEIEVRLIDDNNYAQTSPGAYGYLSGGGYHLAPSGAAGQTDITATVQFFYDPSTGQYENIVYGSLSDLVFNAPAGVDHGELISLLARTGSSGWNDLGDLYAVVHAPPATLLAATPAGLCAIARSYVGQDWNVNGCWLLTADIAARAGASVPETSSKFSTPLYPLTALPNGEWIVAYDATTQKAPTLASALSLLRPGDIVSFGWQSETVGHSVTVVSGYGAQALVIDNSGPASSDGSVSDIVIQGPHSLMSELSGQGSGIAADAASIQIYRLDTPTVTLAAAKEAVALGQPLPLAPLVSVEDAGGAGHLPITEYALYDVDGRGRAGAAFMVGGVSHVAGSASTALLVSAADLSQVELQAAASGASDTVYMRAFNGSYWGDWASLAVTFSPTETAEAAIAQFMSGTLSGPVIVSDSAGDIANSLNGLQMLAAGGELASITVTDAASSTLSVSAAQAVTDGAALSAIAGSPSLTVRDSAAEVSAHLAGLQSLAAAGALTRISLTDGASAHLSVTAGAAVADAAALSLLAAGDRVAVTDTAANVSANLDALQSLAAQGRLASITLSDGGTPVLPLSQAQASADAQALKLIGSAYSAAVGSTLAEFDYPAGHMPIGGLAIDSAGNLFGANFQGGFGDDGTLFEIAKTASGYAGDAITLYSFGGTDGAHPRGNVYAVGGTFYGTTTDGGAFGKGSVYLAQSAAQSIQGLTTLVSFNGDDGAQPYGNVIADADGNLFGTTSTGGSGKGGTVFEIVKGASGYASTPTVLASFDGSNGAELYCSLVADPQGDLFGMAYTGGAGGKGTLFEIVKTATGYAAAPTVLAAFNGANGSEPHGTPVMDARGDIFAVTQSGGAENDGTVFELVKTAGGYAAAPVVLASFGGANGSDLENVTLDAEGNLFGVAYSGGAHNDGVVFEIAKTASGYSSAPVTLLTFDGANGAYPHGSLVVDSAGNLIGTTEAGGSGSGGVVFEIAGVAAVSLSAGAALLAWQSGQMPQHVVIADAAATIQADLDALQAMAASGRLAGISLTDAVTPSITVTAAQAQADAAALGAIGGSVELTIAAGGSSQTIVAPAGQATTVVFSGDGGLYTVTPTGDGSGFTISGNGITDRVSHVQALRFADHTDIVASATPVAAGAVSSAQVTELYGAVLGRLPDLGGLSFYQTYAVANAATGLLSYAEWFLGSPEYRNDPAHAYAQSVAGERQFIADSYQNLLHRAPTADETAFYQSKVIAPLLAGLTPGTAAYAAADAQAHGQVLTYFSQSTEFLADVQVTAQNPTSAQHWLVLV